MKNTQALVKAPTNQIQPTLLTKVADPIVAAEKIAVRLASSGMLGIKDVNAGFVLALTVVMENKTPMEIVNNYHVTDRGLEPKVQFLHAEFRKRGGRVIWKETTHEAAEAIFRFEENEVTYRYTIDQAAKAGVLKKKDKPNWVWKNNPDDMLRATVLRKGIKMLCPEAAEGGDEPRDDFDPVLAEKEREEIEVTIENDTEEVTEEVLSKDQLETLGGLKKYLNMKDDTLKRLCQQQFNKLAKNLNRGDGDKLIKIMEEMAEKKRAGERVQEENKRKALLGTLHGDAKSMLGYDHKQLTQFCINQVGKNSLKDCSIEELQSLIESVKLTAELKRKKSKTTEETQETTQLSEEDLDNLDNELSKVTGESAKDSAQVDEKPKF